MPGISSANCRRPSLPLATAKTHAPSMKARRTVSRPMPRLAPRTTTFLPLSVPMTLCTSCPDCPPGLAMHLKTAAGGETHRVGGKLVPCFLSMMIILLDREHARVSWFSSSHQDVERGNGRRCVHTVDVVVRLGADWERYIVVNPF